MTQEERNKINYDKNHRINESGKIEKLCTFKNHWLVMNNDNFYKYENNSDGFHIYCKKCCVEKAAIWNKNNYHVKLACAKRMSKTEKYKKILKENSITRRKNGKQLEWQRNNRDKMKAYSEKRANKKHKISKTEWENCKKYFNYECAYCGLSINEHYFTRNGITKLGDFHKEHVVCDGNNDLSNCVPSCTSCNTEKHKHTLNEWYNENNLKYSQEKYDRILKWLADDFNIYKDNQNKRLQNKGAKPMAKYYYECTKCGVFEIDKGMNDPHPDSCPKCNTPKPKRLFTATPMIWKCGGNCGKGGS